MNIQELMADPLARFACVNSAGTELVAAPAELEKWMDRMIFTDKPLNMFDPESHGNVVRLFVDAKEKGQATDVVLMRESSISCRIDAFDQRAQFGCIMVVVSPTTKVFVNRTTELLRVPVRRCVSHIDTARRTLWVDDDYQEMFGYAPEEVLGESTAIIIHPEDIDRANMSFAAVLRNPGAESRARLRVQHKSGRWIWLELTRTNQLHTDDPHIRTVALDVTAEMTAHLQLERQTALNEQLMRAVSVAVLQVDNDGNVESGNDRWRDLTGIKPMRNLEDFILAAFKRPVAVCEQLRAAKQAGTDISLMVTFTSPMLGPRRGRLLMQVVRTPGQPEASTGLLLTLEDVTDSLTARQAVEKLIRIDVSSKLLNERGVQEQVRAMLFETTDYELPLQLLYFDLIDLGVVNEHLGSEAADAILQEVAQCLRQSARPQDLVARVSDNKFVVVLRGIAPENAAQVAVRVQGQLATIVGLSSALGMAAAGPDDDYASMVERARSSMGEVEEAPSPGL